MVKCSLFGGSSLAGPLSSLLLAGCSIICWFLSDLSLYGLPGLAPGWAPVQETRMGLQSLLAKDIWVLLLLTEGEKGLPSHPPWFVLKTGMCLWSDREEGMDGWCLAFTDFVSPEHCPQKGPDGAPPPHLHAGGCWGMCWFGGSMSQPFWSSFKLPYKCKGFLRLSRQRLLPEAVTTFEDAALVSFYEVLDKGSG